MDEIAAERSAQDKRWGVQNHQPERWLMILAEEVGEANKAILEGDLQNYRVEMIQIAAVAVAALECFERKTK